MELDFSLQLVDKNITLAALTKKAQVTFGDMVKAVVDVEKGVMVIGGELHADCEHYLLDRGSNQVDLWGINLYPAYFGSEEFIEFDSLINIRPKEGNRSTDVEDERKRQQITAVVNNLVTND